MSHWLIFESLRKGNHMYTIFWKHISYIQTMIKPNIKYLPGTGHTVIAVPLGEGLFIVG